MRVWCAVLIHSLLFELSLLQALLALLLQQRKKTSGREERKERLWGVISTANLGSGSTSPSQASDVWWIPERRAQAKAQWYFGTVFQAIESFLYSLLSFGLKAVSATFPGPLGKGFLHLKGSSSITNSPPNISEI